MGTATTSRNRNSDKPDTRKPNLGTSGMPTLAELTFYVDGEFVDVMGLHQNAKLSERGNVTYTDGFQGWELDGDFRQTLLAVEVRSADGTPLTRSIHGVHQSKRGNPQVFLSGPMLLPVAGTGEVRKYIARVYVTHNEKKGTYSVIASAFPAPTSPGEREPVITAEIGPGFLIKRLSKAA